MMVGPESEERRNIVEARGGGRIREGKGSLCPHRDPCGSIDLLPHWRRHLSLAYQTLLPNSIQFEHVIFYSFFKKKKKKEGI